MPVEVATTASGNLRAFVVCDQRDDVARVAVARDLLEQWACSPERVADVLARLLGTRRSDGDAAGGRWDMGVLKGTKHSAHVVLGIEGCTAPCDCRPQPAGGGRTGAWRQGPDFGAAGAAALRGCSCSGGGRHAVAGATHQAPAQAPQRAEGRRCAQLQPGAGRRRKLLGVAHQTIAGGEKPSANWLGLSPVPKGAVSKKPKTRY